MLHLKTDQERRDNYLSSGRPLQQWFDGLHSTCSLIRRDGRNTCQSSTFGIGR
jgi:hypothetical protein